MAQTINTYKITVLNFFKHNPKVRKSYTHFLVAKNYFHDHKISQLTANESQLFLYCLAIACDLVTNEFEMTCKSLPNHMRMGSKSLANALSHLQSLQLLTAEKINPFIIKDNRIEVNLIKVPSNSKSSLLDHVKPKALVSVSKNKDHNRLAREAYQKAYYERYKVDIVMSAKFHSNIAQIVSRVGHEVAPPLLEFFVWHNDSFYIKGMHGIGLALRDCEALRTQYLKGQAITMKDIKSYETAQSLNTLEKDLEKGGF